MARTRRQTANKAAAAKKKPAKEEPKEAEEEVNYAETADAFAQKEEEDEEQVKGGSDDEEDSSAQNDASDDDDSSDDGEEEEEEENDVSALFRGDAAADDNAEGSENSDSDDDDADAKEETAATSTAIKPGPESCNFDLRNMTAMNSYQIPASALYQTKKKKGEESISIPLEQGHKQLQINEDFLLERASAGCAQLISAIWQLPTETSDAGPLARLPGYDEIPIPRSMPPPPPKQETKWEKFAKAKGIPLNKEKRSRKVWDEETGTWMYRHGFEKANSGSKEWPIMEVGANDDPFEDPWEKSRDAKRVRTEKNLENRMKNEESAGGLAKGMTNRILKSRAKSRESGKKGGNSDRDYIDVLPTGVPVDLKTSSGDLKLRGKASTTAALKAVQQSTASLGRFDKMIEGEPERKKILSKMKKRKYDSATDKKVVATEGQKSMKILNAVMNGGGVAKEKAIRKGKYADGETAYDHEFNDGLGASSFRKKKGRAGAGKMKKMTKKRVV